MVIRLYNRKNPDVLGFSLFGKQDYSNLNQYLSLKNENKFLQRENAKLYSILSKEKESTNLILYEYIPCRIIKNSFNNQPSTKHP